MAKIFVVSLLLAFALAAPAGAACVDEITKVEEHLWKGGEPAAAAGQEQLAAKTTTDDAKEAAVAPPGYSQPQESWHGGGTPVDQMLEDAKELAQDGNDEGCLEKVEQVKRTLEMAPASQNQ